MMSSLQKGNKGNKKSTNKLWLVLCLLFLISMTFAFIDNSTGGHSDNRLEYLHSNDSSFADQNYQKYLELKNPSVPSVEEVKSGYQPKYVVEEDITSLMRDYRFAIFMAIAVAAVMLFFTIGLRLIRLILGNSRR